MDGTAADLQVIGVHKRYKAQQVLSGVDLHVRAGTLTAILGTSGSGKTTLLRIIAGFERADEGAVLLGDAILDDATHCVGVSRRHIGYVAQEGNLFPHLDVAGNVSFGIPRGESRTGRVKQLLELVGLGGFEHRYPHQLSGGQQQRVALARTLAVKPRMILLDEPFASLDASLRQAVRNDVLAILRKTEATTVLVTHDQDEALSMADRVAVIRDGKIAQEDTPRTLYANPADPTIAQFLGEANLLPGTATKDGIATSLGLLKPEDGHRFDAGQTLIVLVRPEQLELGDGISCTVESVRFHGHHTVLRCTVTDSDPPRALVARIRGSSAVREGEPVSFRVSGPVTAWKDA